MSSPQWITYWNLKAQMHSACVIRTICLPMDVNGISLDHTTHDLFICYEPAFLQGKSAPLSFDICQHDHYDNWPFGTFHIRLTKTPDEKRRMGAGFSAIRSTWALLKWAVISPLNPVIIFITAYDTDKWNRVSHFYRSSFDVIEPRWFNWSFLENRWCILQNISLFQQILICICSTVSTVSQWIDFVSTSFSHNDMK